MPDGDVAQRPGRPYINVRAKRVSLSVPNTTPRYVLWKPGELKLLARLSDEEVAAQTGRSIEAVKLKRGKLRSRNSAALS